MNKTKLFAIILSILCCTSIVAQNLTVKGRVLESTGEPIIGASVMVKGSSIGISTDIDGQFQLKAQAGNTLRVSYVGYEPKEVIISADNAPLTIVMEQSNQSLDEVVVVGVSMKRSDLTGAVSHIDSEILDQKPVTTINEALQGRVAGVSISSAAKPSDDTSIKIRGTNTINSGSTPIYVVDGLVMGNDFSFF